MEMAPFGLSGNGILDLERVTGIEPALSAWEADVLPLNYTRERAQSYRPGASEMTASWVPAVRRLDGGTAVRHGSTVVADCVLAICGSTRLGGLVAQDDLTDHLSLLGVSEDGARLYRELLQAGSAEVTELAAERDVSLGAIHDILAELIDSGLV